MASWLGSNFDDTKSGDYEFMDGGRGNDILNSSHVGKILIYGGEVWDFVFIDYIADPHTFGTLYGGPGNDVVFGGALKDELIGHMGDDYVVAHGRGTELYGAQGRDALVGGDGSKDIVIHGGAGNDKGTITVHDLNRKPFSVEAGLYGSVGDDKIYGGAGDDLLDGRLGQDDLWGNKGGDIFRFSAAVDSSPGSLHRDAIKDFNASEHDKIDVSPIDANEGVAGDQAFKFIGTHGFRDRAGELRFKNGVVQGDTDGDGHADFEVAVHISGHDVLAQQDFHL